MKYLEGTAEIAQQVEVPVAKPDTLSVIPEESHGRRRVMTPPPKPHPIQNKFRKFLKIRFYRRVMEYLWMVGREPSGKLLAM